MRTLSQRELNRALLARQRLLERSPLGLPETLDAIGGIQAQYAPSMYVGLWSRMEGLERATLTAALEDRTVVQATLMRYTIHLVSRADYWPLALATRDARRTWWLRSRPDAPSARAMAASARRLRAALDGGTLSRKEIDAVVDGERFVGVGSWIDLVRAPPSGTWERRRADLFAAAEDWLGGPGELTARQAIEHLVRRYLAGFGPASRKDVASFTGIAVTPLRPVLESMELERFAAEDGTELLDVPGSPLPAADVPAPPRFLPTWDATLLVHARRTGLLPEEHRTRIFSTRTPHSVGTFLIDGSVAGTWRYEDGEIRLDPFAPLTAEDEQALRDEADRLATFHR